MIVYRTECKPVELAGTYFREESYMTLVVSPVGRELFDVEFIDGGHTFECRDNQNRKQVLSIIGGGQWLRRVES